MTTVVKGDVFLPEVLADAVKGYFSGMAIMQGSGAAVVNMQMPWAQNRVGEEVTIPYFGSLGEAEDLAADGDALTPAAFAQTNEKATVVHSGKAFELSYWAQSGADDPYEEMARQLVEAVRRRIDKALLDVAKSDTSWSSYIYDHSAVGTGYIDYDAIVKARALLGDEAEEFAAFVCHSKVYTDLLKLKDSAGRPLLIEPGPQPRLTILGVPIIQSDRLAAVASVYPSLLLKRNALVAWVNGNVVVEKDRDILANTDIAAVHLYYAAHRYSKMSGMAKPGVSILKTKAST